MTAVFKLGSWPVIRLECTSNRLHRRIQEHTKANQKYISSATEWEQTGKCHLPDINTPYLNAKLEYAGDSVPDNLLLLANSALHKQGTEVSQRLCQALERHTTSPNVVHDSLTATTFAQFQHLTAMGLYL